MGAAKQRRLDARVRRQESLHNQGKSTTEETIVKVPKQEIKKEVKKEIVNKISKSESKKVVDNKLKNKEKIITKAKKGEVEVKRGRGRPPKAIATAKVSATGSKKKPAISKKGKK